MIEKYVVVRTRNAGVHCGTLKEWSGTVVILEHATRLWRWRGANTLHEVATGGVDRESYTRISQPVEMIAITEAIEIIPVSPEAQRTLEAPIWLD